MNKANPTGVSVDCRTVLLLAKSAFAAAPHQEMQRLAEMVRGFADVDHVAVAFTEQGTPSLREALTALVERPSSRIVLIPLVLPMEPSFRVWLTKTLRRWQAEAPQPWPVIEIAGDIASAPTFADVLAGLISKDATPVPAADKELSPEGSLVPAQKRRVLVCQGGPCNSAGADVIWGHLRNQQERQKLRSSGDGTMTAKSTCLGPCNLAPVIQVFPEGTYYGGVTEAAVDRIVTEHLLGGSIVADFAYEPNGRKQRLRTQTTKE